MYEWYGYNTNGADNAAIPYHIFTSQAQGPKSTSQASSVNKLSNKQQLMHKWFSPWAIFLTALCDSFGSLLVQCSSNRLKCTVNGKWVCNLTPHGRKFMPIFPRNRPFACMKPVRGLVPVTAPPMQCYVVEAAAPKGKVLTAQGPQCSGSWKFQSRANFWGILFVSRVGCLSWMKGAQIALLMLMLSLSSVKLCRCVWCPRRHLCKSRGRQMMQLMYLFHFT